MLPALAIMYTDAAVIHHVRRRRKHSSKEFTEGWRRRVQRAELNAVHGAENTKSVGGGFECNMRARGKTGMQK